MTTRSPVFLKPYLRRALLVVGCFLTTSYASFGQFNAAIGYAYSGHNGQKLNNIVARYNALNPTLVQPMATLDGLHGVDLGLRYRFPFVSLEVNWANKFNRLKDRVRNTDNTEYQNIMYYKNQALGAGLELYYDWFGVGASIDWSRTNVKREKSTGTNKENLLTADGLSSHFYLNFEWTASDVMSFSVRPYVQLPYTAVDYFGVEKSLNPTYAATADKTAYKEKVVHFGIKFLFINGSKNR